MNAIDAALAAASTPFAASAAYLGALAAGAWCDRRHAPPDGPGTTRFTVLIPAHNEARTLPRLFASLHRLDYDRGRWRALVVADNCDDDTAAVARALGATVIERRDRERVGKGYALACGLAHVAWDDTDAVLFLDADCIADGRLLRAVDGRLSRGAGAVQAYYTMRAATPATGARLREVALALVHDVRARGKRWYGGSAGIKGAGMCMTAHTLRRVPWHASGLAEDIEYHVALLRAGISVEYAPETTVVGLAPAARAGAGGQHRRWEAGRFEAMRRYALPLLVDAVRRRRVASLDAAIELLVPPLSVVALGLATVTAAAVALGPRWLAATDAAALAMLAAYIATGFAAARMTPRETAAALAAAPAFVAWKAALYARALVSRPSSWEPTARE